MREVAAEFERPVLLFSGGKDSIVLLRLAEKAFRPGALPVPADARRHRPQLPRGDRVPRPPRRRARRAADRRLACRSRSTTGRVVEETGPRASRNRLQTVTLLDAIAEHGFDAAFGGARRDEERARAKERIFSLPRRLRQLGPEEPAPGAVEPLQRPHPARRARAACSRSPTGPSSTSGSTSPREGLEMPSIYFAHEREVFRRDGMLYATSRVHRADRRRGAVRGVGALPHRRRHELHRRGARRRRATLEDVVAEIAATRITERGETRADDRVTEAAMEDRKKRGLLLMPGLAVDGTSSAATGARRGPAALRHRGLGRRRQVDADRPAALRLQGDLRGPARAGRAGVRAPPRRDGDGRPRAADRRPARRARAGHHDRRRLPLLRDAAAHVHHRRHPGPRPLHAQHGHGRVDRRPGDRAHRRAQRGRRSSRAATRSSPRCCGIPHIVVCVNKMDLVDWDEERLRRGSSTSSRDFAAQARGHRRHVHPDLRAERRQRRRPLARTCRWYGGPPLLYHLEHVHIASDRNLIDVRFPVQWVVRPGDRRAPRLPRLRRPGRAAASCAPATRSSCCRRARRRRSRRIDTFDGAGRGGVPADVGDGPPRATTSTSRAAT